MIQPASAAQATTENRSAEHAPPAREYSPSIGSGQSNGGQRVRQLPPVGRAHVAQICLVDHNLDSFPADARVSPAS